MADKHLINDGTKLKQVEATTVSTGVTQAGDLLQRVGNAISATELSFEAAFPPVEMA